MHHRRRVPGKHELFEQPEVDAVGEEDQRQSDAPTDAEDPADLDALKREIETADQQLREAEVDLLEAILPRAFAAAISTTL